MSQTHLPLTQPSHGFSERLPSASTILTTLILGIALAWSAAPDQFTSFSGTVGLPGNQLKPPSALHWLGTDELGRDLLARIIHGARYSLSGAFVAVSLGIVVGSAIGLIAGAAGGRTDAWLMRLLDVLLAVPTLLLSLAIIMILGFGHVQAALAVGATAIASFARLMRSEVITIWRTDFVEAAFGSGATFTQTLVRHVLPNALTSVLALAALQFGSAILQISTLGFLGYGAPPPTPEWGLLIAEGRNYMLIAWWLTFFPGLTVILVVLAANHLGHSLERKKA